MKIKLKWKNKTKRKLYGRTDFWSVKFAFMFWMCGVVDIYVYVLYVVWFWFHLQKNNRFVSNVYVYKMKLNFVEIVFLLFGRVNRGFFLLWLWCVNLFAWLFPIIFMWFFMELIWTYGKEMHIQYHSLCICKNYKKKLIIFITDDIYIYIC